MAISHGEGGGGGGAGGAFLAMSAASAEVVRPATISNGKATLFITSPFIPVSRWACEGPSLQSNSCENPHSPDMRGLETSRTFQFCTRTAKIKTSASAAFLCFRWKTSHFVKNCGSRDTPHFCDY